MPYVNCPNCGESFHLLIRENVDEWNKRFPVSDDGNRYISCFGCWKELEELDVVEVVSLPIDCSEPIVVGDAGCIVHVHPNLMFEVECVNGMGQLNGFGSFQENTLNMFVQSKIANKSFKLTALRAAA